MNQKNTEKKELGKWKYEALQEIRARAITDRTPTPLMGMDKTGKILIKGGL